MTSDRRPFQDRPRLKLKLAASNAPALQSNIPAPTPTPAPLPAPPPLSPDQVAIAIRVVHIFRQRWPATFPPNKPQPLAIGIHIDIAARAPDLNQDEIEIALAYYTGGAEYLAACVPDANR